MIRAITKRKFQSLDKGELMIGKTEKHENGGEKFFNKLVRVILGLILLSIGLFAVTNIENHVYNFGLWFVIGSPFLIFSDED
ncbi:MAG: hypothetical protein H7Z37_02230 [Pyrinomonadaceae bacterium]|nr:hypothetical protein [Pyrinomonadaceae bacterium]